MSKKKKRGGVKHHNFSHLTKEIQGENVRNVVLNKRNVEELHSGKEVGRELKKSIFFILGFLFVLIVIYAIVTKTNILTPIFNAVGLKGVYGK